MLAAVFAAVLPTIAAAVLTASPAGSPPPAPTRYLNDWAGVVPVPAAAEIEQKLKRFDEETSSQVLVAVFPELPSPSMEDFTVRTAQSWRAGRSKLDNGVVLFVFVRDRKMRLEVGYGLEGALPDALARRIVAEQIAPPFRSGDWGGGLLAGVDAIIAATKGEYAADPRARPQVSPLDAWAPWIFIGIVVLVLFLQSRRGGRTYSRGGWGGGPWISSGGFGGGGGGGWSSGGGGWSGGGGGGFSGGGGSFGGGGASGDW